MYIGNQHTSTIQVAKVVDFKCEHCSFQGPAKVIGVGQGKGNSAYFLDEKGAKKRAYSGAEKNALKNIDETRSIARCLKCGKRSKSRVNLFWMRQAMKLIGAAALIYVIGWLFFAITDEEFVFTIFGICGLLSLVLIYFLDLKWRWFTADSRVEFDDVTQNNFN